MTTPKPSTPPPPAGPSRPGPPAGPKRNLLAALVAQVVRDLGAALAGVRR